MGQEEYIKVLASATALVTVAACTFGAYHIWKKGSISPNQSNTPQVTVRERTLTERESAHITKGKKKDKPSNVHQNSHGPKKSQEVSKPNKRSSSHPEKLKSFPEGFKVKLRDQDKKLNLVRNKPLQKSSKMPEGDTSITDNVLDMNNIDHSCTDKVLYYCPGSSKDKEQLNSYDSELTSNKEENCNNFLENTKKDVTDGESRIQVSNVFSATLGESDLKLSDKCPEKVTEIKKTYKNDGKEIVNAECRQSGISEISRFGSKNILHNQNYKIFLNDDGEKYVSGEQTLASFNEVKSPDDGTPHSEYVSSTDMLQNSESKNGKTVIGTGNDLSQNITNVLQNGLSQIKEANIGEHKVSNFADLQTVWSYLGKSGPVVEGEVKSLILGSCGPRRNLMHRALQEENLILVESLLRLGASIDFCDIQGRYPTHRAASSGNVELLKILSSWGSDISKKDLHGYTPLHRAAMAGEDEAAKWLILNGALIDDTSWVGSTPLHLAAQAGHVHMSELLINNGAQVNMRDNDGSTPLYVADLYKRKEATEFLKSKGGMI